jgi:hypothetical protein
VRAFFSASTETELQQARKERDDIREEKDGIITELQFKIDTMESAYETLLHVSHFLIFTATLTI